MIARERAEAERRTGCSLISHHYRPLFCRDLPSCNRAEKDLFHAHTQDVLVLPALRARPVSDTRTYHSRRTAALIPGAVL